MRSLETQISWFARVQATLAVVIVVAIVAFYFGWYRPATRHMRDLRATLEVSNQKLDASRSKADGLPTVTKAVTDLRRDLEAFDRQVPRHQNLPQFLESLESLKQQAGITKCSTKPDPIQSSGTYAEQAIHVEFEGDFAAVSEVLARVEDLDRMTRVRRLAVKGAGAGRGAVEVQMDVCIYFLEG
jgi:Tfp pilus assembly protein PilO